MTIALTAHIHEAVNGALMSGRPISIAAVSVEDRPLVSFRGSVQTHGDDALSLWARNPAGSLVAAVRERPHVVLTYQNMAEREFLFFHGRVRVVEDAATRDAIYEGMPEVERQRDEEKKGLALVVELDAVLGRSEGEMLQMRRDEG